MRRETDSSPSHDDAALRTVRMPRAVDGQGRNVPLPQTAHLPAQTTTNQASAAAAAAQQEALSVILVTGGYDNTIRFWEAWSGVCSRTITHQDHVRSLVFSALCTDRNESSKSIDSPFRQTNDSWPQLATEPSSCTTLLPVLQVQQAQMSDRLVFFQRDCLLHLTCSNSSSR